ncbi:MAG TPA: ATP-binding protein [Polyangiaceae bacterium]|nr:ATP-binding protein [Polyangiaceae bacterium]
MSGPERAPDGAAEAAMGAPRQRSLADSIVDTIAPAAWFDRLLAAYGALPDDADALTTAAGLLDALADVMPDLSFAACLPGAGRLGEPVVVRRGPLAPLPPPRAPEARAFAGSAGEHAFDLGDGAGSRLHVAPAPPAAEASAHELRLIARAAPLLGSALRRSRLAERAAAQALELRALQEQLTQSEKLASLGQIAAGIVHELNNPLSAIAAYSEYLWRKAERAGGSAADDLQRLRRIHEAADRILRFSRELVAYARPSSGETSPVALNHVVDQALGFCEHALAQSGARVAREFAERLPAVQGVAPELIQVFVNLVTNACHAVPNGGGGLITIRTSHERGTVCVAVADNGHGIEPSLLPRIFDPFFTTKLAGQGTGLGLSIVRHIVARHGGHVLVESEPGQGTRFFVTLPAREPAAAQAEPGESSGAAG